MRIGIAFYGIVDGERPGHNGGAAGSDRDVRHCWPDLEKMLIKPLIDKGHAVSYTQVYVFVLYMISS